jgi:hypothetical protein
LGVTFLVAIGLLHGCDGQHTTPSSVSPTSTVTLIAQTKYIITGTVVVPAKGSRDLIFNVDGITQENIRMVGWFHVTSQPENEIEAFVASESVYQDWRQGRRITPLYNSGRTVTADIDAKIPAKTGRYHLVFNNAFSTSAKYIEAQIKLEYYVAATPTPSSSSEP